MSNRPRSSLASSGLPTPGGSGIGRRKSGIPSSPSPGPSSPSKGSRSKEADRTAGTNEITQQLAELQAAIRAKNPASFASSAHSDDDATGLDSPTATGYASQMETLLSPRKSHASSSSSASSAALRKVSAVSLTGGRAGTPTTPSAVPGRPGSSLSASSYTSANGLPPRAKTPLGGFVTPAKRKSDIHGTPMARGASHASSTSSASAASQFGFEVGEKVSGLGFEGVLRFFGEVDFKAGIWGGIELSGENAGKGKNDGSVQGVQYFACPPSCGIFVPAAKIQALMPPPPTTHVQRPPSSLSNSVSGPTPRRALPRASAAFVAPSTVTREKNRVALEANKVAEARITAGSRASSYLNLTAAQLRERKAKDIDASEADSPEKSSLMSSQASTTSTAGAGPTPRAIRTARPSIGTATPGLPRKSFGGPGTPTPNAGLRRPPSSMRSHTPDIPSVPPLPTHLSNREAASAKSSSSSTVGGISTPARRYSALSRPTTPAGGLGRPSSRLSNASAARSVSRASSRASMASGTSSRLGRPMRGDDPDAEEVLAEEGDGRAELRAAKEALAAMTREAEQAKLELLEASGDLKDERRKTRALQGEVQDLKRNAAASRLDEASAIDARQAQDEKYLGELEKLREQLAAATRESGTTSSSRAELEDEVSRARMELSRYKMQSEKHEAESRAMGEQVEQLKNAGRSLSEIYEERLMNTEAQRREAEDELEATKEELFQARQQVERALQDTEVLRQSSSLAPNSTDAILAASLSAGRSAEEKESAALIDNERLKQELDHARGRVDTLEGQLDDARAELEAEVERDRRRKQESGEVGEKLKRELGSLKEMLKQSKGDKDRATGRAKELEEALKENQAALERERAELESLRSEAAPRPSSSQSSIKDEVAQAHSALRAAENDAREREREIAKLKDDIESLKEELKLAEEIRDETLALGDGTPSKRDTAADASHIHEELKVLATRHQQDMEAKEAEIRELHSRLARSSASSATTASTDTSVVEHSPSAPKGLLPPLPGIKSSPSQFSISPNSSPSLRAKRDSAASAHSHSSTVQSTRRGSVKDEQATMKDEIDGLKFLLKLANDERDGYAGQNKRLIEEARTLKDAVTALEKTVENVMEQMAMGNDDVSKVEVPSFMETKAVRERLEKDVIALQSDVAAIRASHKKEIRRLEDELAGMESLVEVKILREDELESRLLDAERALEKYRTTTGPSAGWNGKQSRERGETVRAVDKRTSKSSLLSQSLDDDDGKCEICHEAHETQDCPIFAGSTISPVIADPHVAVKAPTSSQPYCDDCEAFGHDLANCPLGEETY